MNINNYNNLYLSNPAFGIKLNTKEVLEVTTQKQILNNGIEGMKNVVLALQPVYKDHVGSKGYRGLAKDLGEKILAKYPDLVKPTMMLKEAFSNQTRLSEDGLELVNKITKELGETIDITI